MEMMGSNLRPEPISRSPGLLSLCDIMSALDKTVIISIYIRVDYIITYWREYTQASIGFVVGLRTLSAICD